MRRRNAWMPEWPAPAEPTRRHRPAGGRPPSWRSRAAWAMFWLGLLLLSALASSERHGPQWPHGGEPPWHPPATPRR